tara:strand:+ start:615 stop:1634 length:1020 start_codon:yes stop_codon:yes gene_type:complete
MSALATSVESTQIPTGVGIAIRSKEPLALSGESKTPGKSKIWTMDGDRTRFVPELKSEWSEHFWEKCPHNIPLVSLDSNGEYERLYVSADAMMGEEGKTFTKAEQSMAMLAHALSKKWVCKNVWSNQEEGLSVLQQISSLKKADGKDDKVAQKQKAKEIVYALPDDRIIHYIDLCIDFTKRVEKGDENGRPYRVTEIVRGKIEKCMNQKDTAIKEGYEESGASKEYLTEHLCSTGPVKYISPTSGCVSWNATYELLINEVDMTSFWTTEGVRRKTMTNWFCPLGYYQFLLGINVKGMENLKGQCEMSNGRWVSEEEALQILDAASLNILGHVLANISPV